MSSDSTFHAKNLNLSFRALVYRDEEGGWVAHGLETDLVGEGRTKDRALKSLFELTRAQISFAVQKGDSSLILHPAPIHIIERYEQLYVQTLARYPKVRSTRDMDIGSFPIPDLPAEPASFCPA